MALMALLMVTAYAGVLGVLAALENRFIYHPVRDAEDWEAPPNSLVEDVYVRIADGTVIHAWWCPPRGWQSAQGAVLYCHGNAGNLSHRAEAIACWQRELGHAILIFDYPGYGRSGGNPSEAGCYAAAEAAYHWLVNQGGLRPQGVILFGGSLGGAVAVDLAVRRPHHALILSKTFTSIADMARLHFPWLPVRWLIRNRFDSLSKLECCPGPVFIVHGTADQIVPFSHGKRLFAAAPEPREYLELTGHDHNDVLPHEFYPALAAFLKRTAP